MIDVRSFFLLAVLLYGSQSALVIPNLLSRHEYSPLLNRLNLQPSFDPRFTTASRLEKEDYPVQARTPVIEEASKIPSHLSSKEVSSLLNLHPSFDAPLNSLPAEARDRVEAARSLVRDAVSASEIPLEKAGWVLGLLSKTALQGDEDAVVTLSAVLDEAIKQNVITKKIALQILGQNIKEGLHKQENVPTRKVLREAVELSSRGNKISHDALNELMEWYSRGNPVQAREPMSVEAITEWLGADLPNIKSDLEKVNEKRRADLQVVATALKITTDIKIIFKFQAVKAYSAVLNSALEDKENGLTTLILSLRKAFRTEVVPGYVALRVVGSALGSDLLKVDSISVQEALNKALDQSRKENTITKASEDILREWVPKADAVTAESFTLTPSKNGSQENDASNSSNFYEEHLSYE